jgi:hypothetical protein
MTESQRIDKELSRISRAVTEAENDLVDLLVEIIFEEVECRVPRRHRSPYLTKIAKRCIAA